jgi:membrane protein DedA with SNARE-associated domain
MNSWISDLIAQGGYWSIGLLMALENIFPPIPSELIMGLGGVGVGEGTFHPVALALVYAGYELQQNVDDIEQYIGPLSLGVIGLIVLVYAWRIIFWRPREG